MTISGLDFGGGDMADAALALNQDPHALRGAAGNRLEMAIGREVRACRRRHGMTIIELARAAGLSLGMMSKIENGIISASLTTLHQLSRALAVPLSVLLKPSEELRDARFVKAGLPTERCGTRAGHRPLGYVVPDAAGVSVDPCLVFLTDDADRPALRQHAGTTFIYLLEGEMVWRHGMELYRMAPDDSLFFDAAAPHGPDQLLTLPVRYLSVASWRPSRKG
ncbi:MULTISPECIES: helix-turn-helix domain-containing protein [Aminobacter]|uniref:Transcriptional regulator with XRE-family HTH domain n=1 Tax=Aminobacter aminovorans TaxID=83263 RepID=A0AAC8YS86_AMIAI|nr:MULTISPECIES: XRE family transcriptional regulator [Aminobacter]AMS43343.1 XRE family transcriptional regulator [Aminobacter aminovorans]MBB3706100.1 transcriptional regulator with XRE-family HTH domain [Aminobacter aminovorans]MRX33597.1 helix-turn-helix domain-containing protein [Aminobacter sp. MDW-2]QNH33357.1 helix-turn-helix transcriptional regulator [Aminobacter sp. MDW-2]